MSNESFEVVLKVPGKDEEIPMTCPTLDEFLKISDMYVRGVIEIVSVNGIPVVNVSHIEVVDKAEVK